MEKHHNDTEQQVWQRVLAQRGQEKTGDLRQLQREAMELAAVYGGMATQLGGNAREQVMQLHRGEKANAAALSGLAQLSRQGGEALKLWQPGKEDPGKQLVRCYHRSRRCMTEYMARSADSEFGVVFQKLADREREHCVLITQLLGSIK